MITPAELKSRVGGSEFAKDMENALNIVNETIESALAKGDIRIVLPTHMKLGNLHYYDDKQNALAKKLSGMGFNCKRESEVIGGVRQDPTWFLYFE